MFLKNKNFNRSFTWKQQSMVKAVDFSAPQVGPFVTLVQYFNINQLTIIHMQAMLLQWGNHYDRMRNVPEMLLCSFQRQFELEDLHDSVFVGFIWWRLPLAARQQEPLDSRNPGHPALEGLEGKTKSHVKTLAFNLKALHPACLCTFTFVLGKSLKIPTNSSSNIRVHSSSSTSAMLSLPPTR